MSRAVKIILLIFLTIIAVFVVWIGFKAILKTNSSNTTLEKYNSDLRISQVQMMNYQDINVKIKKTSYKEDIKGVNFVVYDKDGFQMTSYQISMQELENNSFQVVLSVENTSNAKKITIAPVILSTSGEEVVGSLQDEYKITGPVTIFNPPREDTEYSQTAVKYCTAPSDCKDNDPCTNGACSGGLCYYPKIPGCEYCTSNSDCNDNNSCTNNSCINERCSYHIIEGCKSCAYDFQCEDQNPCTEDSCVNNGCIHTPKPNCVLCNSSADCDDNNSCTNNICSFGRCIYTPISNCTLCNTDPDCNDNNPCTIDFCLNGKCYSNLTSDCIQCNSSIQCNDNNPCTYDNCSGGFCKYTPIANCNYCNSNTQCNDNNSCTADFCIAAVCNHIPKANCKACTNSSQCDDNDVCTTDSCSNNVCSNVAISGCTSCNSLTQCEDNNPCTTNTCSNNKCVYTQIANCAQCSSITQCNDNNTCTTDSCSNNVCSHTSINSCTNSDGCCPTGCNYTNDNDCFQCITSNQATTCNDNNACTTDSCSNHICSHSAISNCCTSSSQCNDNNLCTTDSCSNNVCSHTSINSCTNSDGCCPTGCTTTTDNDCSASCGNNILEGTEKCDGTDLGGATCSGVLGGGYTGTLKCSNCQFNTSLCIAPCKCPDDGNPCTMDLCVNNTCNHISVLNCCLNSSQCNDNNACTTNICSNANKCTYVSITNCINNDRCCPTGCNLLNDNDCASVCGNGIREGNEECDDGGKTSGDGCSSSCTVESGWTCNTATPNICTKSCTPSCAGKECGPNSCNNGSCGACTNAHGTTSCSSAGLCQPSCSSGYGNCDGNRVNGCETDLLNSASNCGSCGNACSSSQTCSNGQCVTTCTNECTTSGTKQCSGSGYQTCGNYDSDSCLEWSSVTACTYGCSSGNCNSAPQPSTGYLLVDHNAVLAFSDIPDSCLAKARALTLHYAHTSHGFRVLTGMDYLMNHVSSSKYNYVRRESGTAGLPSASNALRIYDGNNGGNTYITPDLYWSTSTGISYTKSVVNTGDYDYSMWGWCGQMSDASTNINQYLSVMYNFEQSYAPGTRFILMTGHTDAGGAWTVWQNNEKTIKDYAQSNGMILFDYGDIELYDPAGDYYTKYNSGTPNGYDTCTWCNAWCNAHPSDCTNLPDCAHMSSYNYGLVCVQEGKAFWWMMARLAGWDGIAGHGC